MSLFSIDDRVLVDSLFEHKFLKEVLSAFGAHLVISLTFCRRLVGADQTGEGAARALDQQLLRHFPIVAKGLAREVLRPVDPLQYEEGGEL